MNELIVSSLDIPIDASYFWNDSEAVLKYIVNDRIRFQTFVANHMAVIRDATEVDQWHYVSSAQNPANDASIGLRAKQLLEKE